MDITNATNISGVYDIAEFANQASNGILFNGFIIVVFFIMLLVLKKYDFDKAFLASSWLAFILSLVGWSIGLVNVLLPLGFAFLTGLIALYAWFSENY